MALSKSEIVNGLIAARFEFAVMIRLSFDRFVAQYGYAGLAINVRTIYIAVASWIDSLDKYSAYHNNLDPDPHKMAAYLMYWMAKTKPVYMPLGRFAGTERFGSEYLTDKYDSASEMFALNLLSAKANAKLCQCRKKAPSPDRGLFAWLPPSPAPKAEPGAN